MGHRADGGPWRLALFALAAAWIVACGGGSAERAHRADAPDTLLPDARLPGGDVPTRDAGPRDAKVPSDTPDGVSDDASPADDTARARLGSITGQVAGLGWPGLYDTTVQVGDRSVFTELGGRFRFDGLEPGVHVVRFSHHGYTNMARPVVVLPGHETTVELRPRWFRRLGPGSIPCASTDRARPSEHLCRRGLFDVGVPFGPLNFGSPNDLLIDVVDPTATDILTAGAGLQTGAANVDPMPIGAWALFHFDGLWGRDPVTPPTAAMFNLVIELPPNFPGAPGDVLRAYRLSTEDGRFHERGTVTVEARGLDKRVITGTMDGLFGTWAFGLPVEAGVVCVTVTDHQGQPAVGAEVAGATVGAFGGSYDVRNADTAGRACLSLAPGPGEVFIHQRTAAGLVGGTVRVTVPSAAAGPLDLAYDLADGFADQAPPDCDVDPLWPCKACLWGGVAGSGYLEASFAPGRRRASHVRQTGVHDIPLPANATVTLTARDLWSWYYPWDTRVFTTAAAGTCDECAPPTCATWWETCRAYGLPHTGFNITIPETYRASDCRERFGTLTIDRVTVTGADLDMSALRGGYAMATVGTATLANVTLVAGPPGTDLLWLTPHDTDGPYLTLSLPLPWSDEAGGFAWCPSAVEWPPGSEGRGVLAGPRTPAGHVPTYTTKKDGCITIREFSPFNTVTGQPGVVRGDFELTFIANGGAVPGSRVVVAGRFDSLQWPGDVQDPASRPCRDGARHFPIADPGLVRVWFDGVEQPRAEYHHMTWRADRREGPEVFYLLLDWQSHDGQALSLRKGFVRGGAGGIAEAADIEWGTYGYGTPCGQCVHFLPSNAVDATQDATFIGGPPFPTTSEWVRMSGRFSGRLNPSVFSYTAPDACGPVRLDVEFDAPFVQYDVSR